MAAPETALYKPEIYEIQRIQLTSPILHIGSAVSKLSPFEYVQTGKRVYLPNQEALAKTLYQRGWLQDYIRKIENREDITSLLQDVFGNSWQTALDLNEERIFPEQTSSLKWTTQKITDLRPMIRNGMGQLYIPGSSIKGAIRTAIAYHLLKHKERYQVPSTHRISEIERKLRETMGNLRQQAKVTDDKLFMEQLFTDFALSYQEQPVSSKQGPNTDIMRAVHITDSEPLLKYEVLNKRRQPVPRNLPVVVEVIVSSHFPDGKAKYKAPIFTEMVWNVNTQFTVSLDSTMLSWFHHTQGMQIPFKTVDDILKICQEFAQDQWDEEHDYWQEVSNNPHTKDNNGQSINLDFDAIREFYQPEKCPYGLRLGWASGMTGTTINLLLPDDLRQEIRDTCGLKAPGFEAPKSRRVVAGSSREIKFVPGWAKFKVL